MTPDARLRELHDHYASSALVCGHAPICRMVTDTTNWPTLRGRPPCTCQVGGNTADAQIAYRHREGTQ